MRQTPSPVSEAAAPAAGGRHRVRRGRAGAVRATLAVVPLALLASGALVYQASNAAFTATTSTGANSWTAGTVTLTNSSSGSALFDATADGVLKPGTTTTRCVLVSYSGTLTSSGVKFYLKNKTLSGGTNGATNGHSLDQYLKLTVEDGSMPAASTSCAGFASNAYLNSSGASGDTLSSLATALTDYSHGVGSWTPAGQTSGNSTTRAYRISWWLPDVNPDDPSQAAALSTLNDLQGLGAAVNLTWEARS